MPSIIVLFYLVVATCWAAVCPAWAQGKRTSAGDEIEIEVRPDAARAETCLTSQQLSARVAHYSSPSARSNGLRLLLYITGADAAELHILRAGSVVSRRSFKQLPAPCADRRDAVALSIALALERTAGAAADGGSDRPGEAASTSGSSAVAASGSGTSAGSSSAAAGGAEDSVSTPPIAPNEEPAEPADKPEPAVQEQPVREPEAAREEQDKTPIVFDNVPTTTSRDPRQKGASASSLQLHLGARVALEVVPVPVWIGALGLELPITPRLSLGITGLVSSVGEGPLAGAHARASFLGLEIAGCASFPLGVFLLQACGGAGVALCDVSGRDFPRERAEATLLWAAVLGRASLRWPRESWISLRLVLQPHVGISRPELHVDGSSERLRSSFIGGSAGLELWLAL